MLLPLEAHDKTQLNEIFLSFRAKNLQSCIFYLLAHPAETAYLSFRDGELSNDVLLVQVRPRKVAVHNLFGVGPGQADKTALVQELSKAINFFSYSLSW